jgi:HTH-type transcriptional regulator/antitoxin HigA
MAIRRSNKTTDRFVDSNTSKSTTAVDRQVVGRREVKGFDISVPKFDKVAPAKGKAKQNNRIAKRFDAGVYGRLLTEIIPKVIDSQEEYDRIEARFESLLDKGDTRSAEEDSLFDLLANLLEDYEKRTLAPLEPTSPVSTLKFLMDENGLNQTDMVEYFGSQGNVSQVLSGKRAISKGAAQRLSERFKLSIDIFLKNM